MARRMNFLNRREQRRDEAQTRQAARAKLLPQEQLMALTYRGEAKRERAHLRKEC